MTSTFANNFVIVIRKFHSQSKQGRFSFVPAFFVLKVSFCDVFCRLQRCCIVILCLPFVGSSVNTVFVVGFAFTLNCFYRFDSEAILRKTIGTQSCPSSRFYVCRRTKNLSFASETKLFKFEHNRRRRIGNKQFV